jgi:hypothetical protein
MLMHSQTELEQEQEVHWGPIRQSDRKIRTGGDRLLLLAQVSRESREVCTAEIIPWFRHHLPSMSIVFL